MPHKIKVMITPLIEMVELPNFGHMTTSTIKAESRDKILLMMSRTENYEVTMCKCVI